MRILTTLLEGEQITYFIVYYSASLLSGFQDRENFNLHDWLAFVP